MVEECFIFQWGEGCFSDGWDFIFKWGGAPWEGISLFFFGGGVRKKLLDRGRAPHTPLPLLWETLIHPHTKTVPFWKAEETQDHSFETVGGYRSSCANIEKIISNIFGNGISHYSKYFYHISISLPLTINFSGNH